MSSPATSPFSKLWLKWKALKLPWRKRWLAGTDLDGNTFWYFKSGLSPRPRRILGSNPRIAYSDIQISPQWHQWLRYTRPLPPTISEQQADFVRRQELKLLAQAADERWAAKPSLLDKPREEIFSARIEETKQSKNESSEQETQNRDLRREKQWQPEAWMPASKR